MVKKYLPSDFRQVADIGEASEIENPYTGVIRTGFKPLVKVHYKPHTRTLNQQYQAVQAGLTDTLVIVIRHNKNVSDGQLVRLNGIVYNIEQLSPDENFGIGKYDFLTLRKAKKVG